MSPDRTIVSTLAVSLMASAKTTVPASVVATGTAAILATTDQIPGWSVVALGIIGGVVVIAVAILKGYKKIDSEAHSITVQRMKHMDDILGQKLASIELAMKASATDMVNSASVAASAGAQVGAEAGVAKTVTATMNGPLESIIRNCPHPFWIKEVVTEPSGNVRFVMKVINTAYCRRFGRAREHYEGFDDFEVWDHKIAKLYYESDMVVYTTGRPDEFREKIGETLDGVRSIHHGKDLSVLKWVVRYKNIVGIAGIILPIALDTDAV